jgi:hypothetical protein
MELISDAGPTRHAVNGTVSSAITRGWIEMNLRNEIHIDLCLGRQRVVTQDFGAAVFKFGQEPCHADARITRLVVLQVTTATEVQLLRTAKIPIPEVMEANSKLYQTLVESS